MAGSYIHVTNDTDGSLGGSKFVRGMLDTDGDVFEAIEQMYGMIWHLAHTLAAEDRFNPDDYEEMKRFFVQEAMENYKFGLAVSPTERYKE